MTKSEMVNKEIANLYNTIAEEVREHLKRFGGKATFTSEDKLVDIVADVDGVIDFTLRSAVIDGDDIKLLYQCGEFDPIRMETEMRVLPLPECVEILKALESR